MLARCKWSGDRYSGRPGQPIYEYGTVLEFVHTGNDTMAVIAMDGYDQHTRGKVIKLDLGRIRITTFFNWMGEGYG